MPDLTAVAAISANNVLSRDGRPPWDSIEADKEQYRDLVRDHPLIFGETTYDKKQRTRDVPMLVLTYDPDFEPHAESHTAVTSKREALEWIENRDRETFVMGGGEAYRLFWRQYDRLVISHIPGAYDGDVFFPEIRDAVWKPVETINYDQFTRVTYRRR